MRLWPWDIESSPLVATALERTTRRSGRSMSTSSILVREGPLGGYGDGGAAGRVRSRQLVSLLVVSLRWRKLPPACCSPSKVPYMRYGHTAVLIDDIIYIWGGRNDTEGACNVLYTFHTGNELSAVLPPPLLLNPNPLPCYRHGAVDDSRCEWSHPRGPGRSLRLRSRQDHVYFWWI